MPSTKLGLVKNCKTSPDFREVKMLRKKKCITELKKYSHTCVTGLLMWIQHGNTCKLENLKLQAA